MFFSLFMYRNVTGRGKELKVFSRKSLPSSIQQENAPEFQEIDQEPFDIFPNIDADKVFNSANFTKQFPISFQFIYYIIIFVIHLQF